MATEDTRTSPRSKRVRLAAAAAALIAVGGTAGAIAVGVTRPSIEMAPLRPVAIRSLADGESVITLKGRVAEVYGNKFVMADASGRALVDTGRRGEDQALVATGQPVTVQGRFDHGFLHASFLIGADGKVVGLAPAEPPRGHRGPKDGHGPRGEAPPPPPPPPVAEPAPPPVAEPAPPAVAAPAPAPRPGQLDPASR